MPEPWVLIFSDGTGQRGVRNDDSRKNTNVFQMYAAADGMPISRLSTIRASARPPRATARGREHSAMSGARRPAGASPPTSPTAMKR